MSKNSWQSRVAAAILIALAVCFFLSAIRPAVSFRVDDVSHLAFSRHVTEKAGNAAGSSGILYPAHLVSATVNPGAHFSHVHPGRPVTNLFRVLLYQFLGENPESYQTVLLLLLVLLTALLAELGGYLSGHAAGGFLCALLFISCPPAAGLLAWTSHLNLALGLVLAAAGLRLTLWFIIDGNRAGLLFGIPFLLAALLTRETELFVIPAVLAAVAVTAGPVREIRTWRRLGPLVLYLAVSGMLWAIPAFRARSGGGVPLGDLALTLQLAWVTFLTQAGTVLKSLAWFLLLPLAMVRPSDGGGNLVLAGGRAGLVFLAVAVLTLLLLPGGTVHALLLLLILAMALVTGGRAVTTGLVWAAAAGLPILVYGAFAGRYSVEPLFGLCLALSPLLGGAWAGLLRRRRAAGALVLGLTVLQLLMNFCPDTLMTAVHKPGILRRSGHWGEGLVRAMESRADAFATFADRVPGTWQRVEGWRHPSDEEGVPTEEAFLLWHDPQGRYLRLGTYYSPMEPDLPIWALLVEDGESWEWNRWFWRSARIKGPGRMLPRLGGLPHLAGVGSREGGSGVPPVALLWSGDTWNRQRLVAAIPELTDPDEGLALFNHYRQVAEARGATEEQAMVLFETARLFLHEDGRCDAYEKHLLDRIAIGW